ncbi:unnamed protein product [Closterium sp. NIES-64]|nr:unnamed protein product [Closterium sp. NIES-64]
MTHLKLLWNLTDEFIVGTFNKMCNTNRSNVAKKLRAVVWTALGSVKKQHKVAALPKGVKSPEAFYEHKELAQNYMDGTSHGEGEGEDTHRGGGRERVRNFLTRSYSHPFLSLCPYLPAIGRTRTEEEGGRGGGGRERVRSAWARSYSHLFLSLCLLISPPLAGHAQRRREGEAVEMHRGVGKEAVVCVSLHAACIGFDSYPATPLILSSVSVLISLPLAGNAQRWREGEAEEMQRREGEAKVCVGLYIAPLCIALVSLTLLEIEQIKEMGGLRIHVDTEDTQLPFSSKAFAVGIRHAFTRTNVTLGAFKTRQIAYAVLVLECPLLEEEGRMTNNPEVNREKYESTVVKCRKWVELAVTTMGVRYDSRKNAFLFGNGVCIDASDYPASLKKNVTGAQMLQRLLSPSRDDTREQTLVHAAAVTVTTGTTAFDTCSIAAAGEGLQKRSWEQAVMPMQSRQGAEGAIDGQLITSEVSRKRSLSQDSSTGVEGVLDGQLKALLLEMEEEERRAVQAPLVE